MGAANMSAYTYAINRPTTLTDPSGRCWGDCAISIDGVPTSSGNPLLGHLSAGPIGGFGSTSSASSRRSGNSRLGIRGTTGDSLPETHVEIVDPPFGNKADSESGRKGERIISTPHGTSVVGEGLLAAHNDMEKQATSGSNVGYYPSGAIIRERNGKFYLDYTHTGRWVVGGHQVLQGSHGTPVRIKGAAAITISVPSSWRPENADAAGYTNLSYEVESPVFVSFPRGGTIILYEHGFAPLEVGARMRGQIRGQ